MKSWITQVRKGIVELCVMSVLREGEAYGYQLLQRLSDVEGLAITESAIYPILSRLTTDGMLSVRTVSSPDGPSRRYYRLTPPGRLRLREMLGYWRDLQHSVEELLKGGS